MGGLMELGPMTEEISVMGGILTIRPITTGQLITLFGKFPILVELLGGEKSKDPVSTVGVAALAHVIATSTGEADNPEAVARAEMLSVGKVAEIIDRIMVITFEDGTGPFVQRIKRATRNTKTLMSEDSSTESSVPWSASLTGDAPRKTRLPLRRVS
jgi:hypothetical protein